MSDVGTALKEIETWPVADRVALLHQLWDRLLDAGWQPELTEELRAELDRRLDEMGRAPEDFLSWDTVAANARRRRQ